MVAWTLAIEAQFYLLIALAMPGVTHPCQAVRIATFVFWILSPLVLPFAATVFPFCAVFAYGLLLYGRHCRFINERLFWGGMGLASLVNFVAGGGFDGAAEEVALWVKIGVGVSTVISIILLRRWGPRSLVGVGTISYSLYLLHVPIGGRIMNFADRYDITDGVRCIVAFGVFFASCVAARGFYQLVELPSHRWARRFRLIKAPTRED